ncbi:MAG: helix-turn-helix transcriptional regulator [Sulfurimonas sp.]|nr:helix-turn-helix transcriptional regulator [Sulfurimonas sp.]
MLNLPDIVTKDESEEFFKVVSCNVKRIRIERKISQLEVALSIGQKSSGFYANTENYSHGKHFNLLHLFKLSKLFDVPIAKFFEPIKSD